MKKIEKVDVAVMLGFIMSLSLSTAQVEAADIEVIVTQDGGIECVMTTFENGGQNAYIADPDVLDSDLITGSVMRFPLPWKTFNQPATGYSNNPSGSTVAFWEGEGSNEVLFDEPVCGVGLFYASYSDVTVTCYDASDSVVASTSSAANFAGSFCVWDPLWLEASDNVITKVVVSGMAYYTLLDDFSYCRLSAIDVSIDIKPGSYPNAINLRSHGMVPVAILSEEQFDATTVDPDTVELAGASVEVRGKSNKYMAHEEDVNGDGLVDLVVQVATENLDPGSFQDGYAILTAETFDGQLIEGMDEITIVPPEE